MSDTNEQQTTQTESRFDLLTPEQLAQQLNVTTRTLQRWHVQRDGPPRVEIGRQIFYRTSSLDVWLSSRERGRKVGK